MHTLPSLPAAATLPGFSTMVRHMGAFFVSLPNNVQWDFAILLQVGLLRDHNPLQERLAQLAGMIKARGCADGGGEGRSRSRQGKGRAGCPGQPCIHIFFHQPGRTERIPASLSATVPASPHPVASHQHCPPSPLHLSWGSRAPGWSWRRPSSRSRSTEVPVHMQVRRGSKEGSGAV